MKGASCLLLLAAGLMAQPASQNPAEAAAVRKLNSTLSTLKNGQPRDAVSRQFAADLAAVADPDHRPARPMVLKLANDLVAALPAGDLRADQLSPVTRPIVEVLHSAGTSTIGFYETVSGAEKALITLGVDRGKAQSIAGTLKTIGMQVRGPDDSPVDRVGHRSR